MMMKKKKKKKKTNKISKKISVGNGLAAVQPNPSHIPSAKEAGILMTGSEEEIRLMKLQR